MQNMTKPNILLLFSDQQHWQAMGCMDPFFDTPHLDAFAEKSVLFERSFCTTPQCSPSRSSMFTGFYPSSTGVMGNCGAAGGGFMAQKTIGAELQDAGYCTGYFGKWHIGDDPVGNAGWTFSEKAQDDPRAEANAISFLQSRGGAVEPFALVVSLNNPHDIYHYGQHEPSEAVGEVPLPPSWDLETLKDKPPIQAQFMEEDQGKTMVGQSKENWQNYRDCYREKTRLYDAQVGRILEELKKQGLWDSTIVIITSDHGDMDTQHKLIFKGPFLYDQLMRVPLMMHVPETFGSLPAQRINHLDVVNVDLAPTIREFCGLAAQETQGKSLAPLFMEDRPYQARDFVVGQYYSKQKWINPIRMIRTEHYKLNKHLHWQDELYDLKTDPHEITNLAMDPEFAEVMKELEGKLDQWMEEHQDPFYSFEVTDISGERRL
ncbi:sulfatase-like hydrolase/transferase [Kiritimatiellaeota bacterium B1221]|nr:sulfatase-like hydrolase/transferase [Kiritimatiellaeota bacterium B1221]